MKSSTQFSVSKTNLGGHSTLKLVRQRIHLVRFNQTSFVGVMRTLTLSVSPEPCLKGALPPPYEAFLRVTDPKVPPVPREHLSICDTYSERSPQLMLPGITVARTQNTRILPCIFATTTPHSIRFYIIQQKAP